MRSSIRPRLTAWLALVAVLLMGVAPRQELVLCFEPDGTIALEAAGASRACADADEPAAGDEASGRLVAAAGDCCACLDIPVDAGDEARVRVSSVELRIDLSPALGAESAVAPLVPICAPAFRPHGEPPGSPGILAHIRSVVLRV
jgi:hypothetical protein